MKTQTGFEKIRNYFKDRNPDELYNDLVECGLNDIESWSDMGVELANFAKLNTYTVKINQFEFAEEKSYSAYNSDVTEAA